MADQIQLTEEQYADWRASLDAHHAEMQRIQREVYAAARATAKTVEKQSSLRVEGIRDAFACHALTGMTRHFQTSPSEQKQMAAQCYEIADAMIEARKA